MASSKNTSARLAQYVVDPLVRIGHVHLKVADLQRALWFYSGVLGMEVTQRFGDSAVFLSAGGYHHHIALNTWKASVDRPRRQVQQGYITLPSSIQLDLHLLLRCKGCWLQRFRCRVQQTTGSANRST
jgi:catechol-2,3-dioxygenase